MPGMARNTGLSASAMEDKKKKSAKKNKDTVLGGGAEKGKEVQTRATEGAAAGSLAGPIGTVVGAAIGAGAGLAESNKNKKADAETTTRPKRRRVAAVRSNINRRKQESVARTATLAQSVAKWQKDLR